MSHLALRSNSNLIFKVRRQEPELIQPATPTPRELKLLSDIDDQEAFRFHIPVCLIYPGKRTLDDQNNGRDPANVIKAALAVALVYYYPLAGRLREVGDGRKLAVDCTGEGVMFVEGDADVRLDDFGEEICLPFPRYEQWMFYPPGSSNILESPLVLIQVTRFLCGGFIFGIRMNHTMCDARGLAQFINAVAEIGKGGSQPPLLPVWNRELIKASDPPKVMCSHREYDAKGTTNLLDQMIRCFFFGPEEVAALRRLIPSNFRGYYSSFDLLVACVWRCRAIALGYSPDEEVRALLTINARSKFNPPLPAGHYGNAFAYSAAITTVEQLLTNPPAYALDLIRRAKDAITTEHLISLPNFLVVQGRPKFTMHNSYLVSDLRHVGFSEVDFGWGRPVYCGAAHSRITSFFMTYENKRGTKGVMVPMILPQDAMERFTDELGIMLKGDGVDNQVNITRRMLSSL